MVKNDAGMGRPAYAKGGRVTEIWRKKEAVLDLQRGRWERNGTEHRSGSPAGSNGEINGADDGGTFGEPLLPHGG